MPVSETLVIGLLFFAGAALYASVGHGGASSYLAVMGLFSFAPSVMKPTALALNILVAAVATLKFFRAGLFSLRIFRALHSCHPTFRYGLRQQLSVSGSERVTAAGKLQRRYCGNSYHWC